jgi:hypothetical protein
MSAAELDNAHRHADATASLAERIAGGVEVMAGSREAGVSGFADLAAVASPPR